MSVDMLGLTLLLVAGVAPCLVGGYLIAFRQKRHLISGWDESRYTDPQKVAKIIGAGVLALGIIIAIISWSFYLKLIGELALALSLVSACLIPVLCQAYATLKYTK